jgi:molybdopterin molybdotransferase
MMDWRDARAVMLAQATATSVESVTLDAVHGRTLAEDIIATRDQPPFDASAMDGYALRAADAPGRLRIVGESVAGKRHPGALGTGEAVRIFTGAPIPAGADTVAIQEEVRRDGDEIEAPAALSGAHVRRCGNDFASGARLLKSGVCVDGVALALAAAAGVSRIRVQRKPRVAVLATGDEIVSPADGVIPGPDQIFDALTPSLAALISRWGGTATPMRAVGDDVETIAAAIEAARGCDLVVLIGGASVGDRDLVKPALERFGLDIKVGKIALRPGKPTWFAVSSLGPILGLPGNPASALVCAHLFLRPLIERMLGHEGELRLVKARLATPLPKNGPRAHFIRSRTEWDDEGRRLVHPLERQDSSLLSVFQAADVLTLLPANAPELPAGAIVEVLPLDRDQ